MISLRKIIAKSIVYKMYRSIGLVIVGMLMAGGIVITSLITLAVKSGSDNAVDRLGADIIVVPYGCGDNIEKILVTAQKSYFYMDMDLLDEIDKIKGVEKVSPQVFLTTMEASCCDDVVQIVGIDTDTDFTIIPWIKNKDIASLGKGEIIVGANVGATDDKFSMFGHEYKVAAVLEESGTSMDTTVYVSISEIRSTLEYAKAAGQGLLGNVNEKSFSAAMIKVDEEESISSVVARLSRLEGIDIVTSESVSLEIYKVMSKTYVMYYTFVILIGIISVLIIFITYYITMNERKNEVEIFRVLGVSLKKVKHIILCEVAVISAIGSAIGVLFGMIVFHVIYRSIAILSNIPFLMPVISQRLLVYGICLLSTFLLELICAYINMGKINKREVLG